jgi:Uma2 family endonuclease
MFDDTNIATNPLAVLPPVKEPRLYTLGEYLRKEERSQELHEYENGIITKLPMAKGPHNIISANVTWALKNVIKTEKRKYVVLGNQQLVYLPQLNFARYPDILVVAEAPLYWENNESLLINPILIVEVLSRSTRAYDRKGKFEEYVSLDSFKEYLLVDQKKCHVERRFREEHDLWRNTNFTDISTSILLKSLDCSISMADIYENVALSL